MTWYENLLYDFLPEGVYIRCCRVVRKKSSGYTVAILHLRRSKQKKALVLEHNGYRFGRHTSLWVAEDVAKSMSYSYALYLPAGKLDEESAVKLLRSYNLTDYIGFDRRLALPGESVEDTIYRLIPEEALNNIRVMMDLMI